MDAFGGDYLTKADVRIWLAYASIRRRTRRLNGESLQPVPSLSSYDWAWRDFYPDSKFYAP